MLLKNSIFLFMLFITSSSFASLNDFLKKNNYILLPGFTEGYEGYMSDAQKKQFVGELNKYKNIKHVLEVGLNAGHSAEMFFLNLPNLKKFYSFDINHHSYTSYAVQYFSSLYADKFIFIEGDSSKTLKTYPNDVKMDLIYIDGDHCYNGCYQDIVNSKRFAKSDTILWVDDYSKQVRRAVDNLVKENVIIKLQVFNSNDLMGKRRWVKCKYKNIED